MINFGENMKRLRRELGIRQTEIAEKVGVCTATICGYENNVAVPPLDKALAIAEALGVHITDMLEMNRESSLDEIKIKYLRDVEEVARISNGDWIDLRAGETVKLKAGEYAMIPLGFAMELPKGYEAIVAPRSSTFRKYGVISVNSIGIIDESYCGENDEWNFLVYAIRDTVIPKNDRICQFRIIEHQPAVAFEVVETLGNPDRGGIGSTGRV